MNHEDSPRRDFLKTAGATALTTNLFTGKVKGANDRVSAAFIGMGRMGMGNLGHAMKQENLAVAAVCDIYQPHLEKAVAATKGQAKGIQDFREILADRSIDVVCISTPDHWHAYMEVEACKAGKDVYVEKPICCTVDEGQKMVQAARKYKRVVQAGTMQRSGIHFQQACDIVRSGKLGKVTIVHTLNAGLAPKEGIGKPPDSDPPPGLNWDMWLGPAPKRPYNKNRFGVDPKAFSHFRWFWDYAGGMMTDWGIHWLDIVQMAFDEACPKAITALGGNPWLEDNRETPDLIHVTCEYPGFLATYENRNSSSLTLGQHRSGIYFHGTKGTMFLDRSLYHIVPERGSDLEEVTVKSSNNSNMAHWANFLECVKTREKPMSDIEKCYRSTATCLLGNVSYRSKLRIDWDADKGTIAQPEARKYLTREYRKPWKLVV